MRANLESTGGLIYTSAVLLELVGSGLSREDAYALAQAAAMETWETGAPFRETLRAHAAAAGLELDEARLDEVCGRSATSSGSARSSTALARADAERGRRPRPLRLGRGSLPG